MKKVCNIIIILFVVTIYNSCSTAKKTTSGTSVQPTNVIEMPYDGALVEREITFPVSHGIGDPIIIPMGFQWNKSAQTFNMIFKSAPAYGGKFIYLFAKTANMKDIEKVHSNVLFHKQLKKDSKNQFGAKIVKPHCSNLSSKDELHFFDLSQGFTKTFNQNELKGVFYAYIATKNVDPKRDRQIIFLAEVHFNIYPAKSPCVTEPVKKKIAEFAKFNIALVDSIGNVQYEATMLPTLRCKEAKTQSPKIAKSKNDYPYSDCEYCNKCDSFNTEKDKLYLTIEKYNSAVKDYNDKLYQRLGGCDKCGCNCGALENIIQEKLGPLFVNLSTNTLDKTAGQRELNAIKSSIKCYGNDCKNKNCNTICSKECKDAYKKYQNYCSKIEELLK